MGIRQSTTFKLKAVERVLNRTHNERLEDIAQQFSIGYSTLTRWMSAARQDKLILHTGSVLAREKRPRDWTAAEKLEAIVDPEQLSEQETCQYCHSPHLPPCPGYRLSNRVINPLDSNHLNVSHLSKHTTRKPGPTSIITFVEENSQGNAQTAVA